MLLHLVDGTEEDVAASYRTVRREIKAYGAGLEKKKEIVALTKCDALDAATIAERVEALRAVSRKKPLVISAVSGQGMKEALFALARELTRVDDKEREAEEERQPQALLAAGLRQRPATCPSFPRSRRCAAGSSR